MLPFVSTGLKKVIYLSNFSTNTKTTFFLALFSPQSSLTRLLSPLELVYVTYDKYFAGEFCCQLQCKLLMS